jgi:hypothetical protein
MPKAISLRLITQSAVDAPLVVEIFKPSQHTAIAGDEIILALMALHDRPAHANAGPPDTRNAVPKRW